MNTDHAGTRLARTVIGAMLGGLVTGISGLVITCVAALAIAFSTRREVVVPGVCQARLATVDGMTELSFRPDTTGMVVALVIWIAMCGAIGAVVARRRNSAPRAQP